MDRQHLLWGKGSPDAFHNGHHRGLWDPDADQRSRKSVGTADRLGFGNRVGLFLGSYLGVFMKVKYVCMAVVLLAGITSLAQVSRITAVKQLPNHPRILLLPGEEASIQKAIANDATWRKVHQIILLACEGAMTQPPVERIQIGRRLLDKSRECLGRVFYLSYAWRMTREEKYLKRAEKELLAVSAFSDWNPSHFLDVAEMTMAAAIGYDWLYSALAESSRTRIKEAILEKGIRPSFNSRHNNWLKAPHNWNQVCNAGMTFGA